MTSLRNVYIQHTPGPKSKVKWEIMNNLSQNPWQVIQIAAFSIVSRHHKWFDSQENSVKCLSSLFFRSFRKNVKVDIQVTKFDQVTNYLDYLSAQMKKGLQKLLVSVDECIHEVY